MKDPTFEFDLRNIKPLKEIISATQRGQSIDMSGEHPSFSQ